MRKLGKWLLIIIGGAFAIGLVASLVTPDGRAGLHEGLAAAAEPTVNTQADSYTAWADHILSIEPQITSDIDTLSDAANRLDLADLRGGAVAFQSTLATEQEWIVNNPASACFADAQAAWSDGVDLYSEAMGTMIKGVDALDPDRINLASELLTAGNAKVTRSTDLLDSVSCE